MLQIAPITIHPCYNSPHVEGLIAISPYTCVFWTFVNIDVNTCKYTKKHHGHGVSTFACVVGAICKSPTLQFTHVTIRHVTIRPHVEGLIAISPYTGVIRTLANIHEYNVNIRKKHHGHGVSMFTYVVGANCNSPMSQFAHIANYPCYKSPPCGRANCN